jgi:hypothetical protein
MDVDLDFADRSAALTLVKHIRASRFDTVSNELVPHNTGVYFQKIPFDPIKNLSTVDYKQGENRGYFKIDFLNLNVYKGIKNRKHLQELISEEPLWDLLEQPDFVKLLMHIGEHSGVVCQYKPKSIIELAAVLSIIRPAKRYLIGKDWDTIFSEVWTKPENGEYYFKKSHAHSYATAIVAQMNLICEQISYGHS